MRESQLRREGDTIIWKDIVWNSPQYEHSGWKEWMTANFKDIPRVNWDIKKFNKELTDYLDCPPTTFYAIFMKLQHDIYIKPYEREAYGLAYNNSLQTMGYKGNRWNHGNIVRMYENRDNILTALGDGLRHIIPVLTWSGMDVKGTKALLGKGLWKSLCKNSFTRNSLIINGLPVRYIHNTPRFLARSRLPSTILKYSTSFLGAVVLELGSKIITELRGSYGDEGEVIRVANLCSDMRRMALSLGYTPPTNPSLSQVEKLHDRYKGEINLKKYSKEAYTCLSEEVPREWVSSKGDTYKLLDSPYNIYTEGDIMHHCVGSYASSVGNSSYLVFSVNEGNKDRERSTLGVRINKGHWEESGKYGLGQQYLACNRQVNEESKSSTREFISFLNRFDSGGN